MRTLSEELDENEKNKQSLESSKLNVLKDIISLQNKLYQEQTAEYEEIFNKLDVIAKNQKFEVGKSVSLIKNSFAKYVDNETKVLVDLIKKGNQLDNQIVIFEEKSKKLATKIHIFEKNIDELREQKSKKSWQITCLNIITFGIFKYHKNKKIDKEIKQLKNKTRDLSKQFVENEKNKQPLESLKLRVLEDIISLQDIIFIKIKMQQDKDINQRLTIIIDKQVVESDESNLVSTKKEVIERHNSEDSGFDSETKQSNNDTDILNFSTEDKETKSNSSSCSINFNEILIDNSKETIVMKAASL